MPQPNIDFNQPQSRELNIANERSAVNDEDRTVELAFSSEAPYSRWYGQEILDHKAESVDLSRLNNGAALLLGHDSRTQIGVVERAWIDGDKKGRAVVRFSKSALAEEIFQDVKDGIRRLVSVGYSVEEHRHDGEINNEDIYRMTKWTPYEISIVPVPADATVGIGRNHTPTLQTPKKDNTMPPKDDNQPLPDNSRQAGPAAPAPTPSIQMATNPLEDERNRMKEIRAMARQFDKVDLGDVAIDNGMSVDAFRAQLLGSIGKNGAIRTSENPEIGLTEKEVTQFSFARALLAASDPMNAHKLAPFEYECSRAAQDQRGDSRTERQTAMTIPVDVLARSMNLSPDAAMSAMRMMGGRRDLIAGANVSGGYSVANNLLAGSFIEMLRNAMVLSELGVTFFSDLMGNIAIPSQTGSASAYWVDESGSPTQSQQTLGQVTMSPKTVGAFTDYSRRLLLQSSIDVEAFVRADLASIIGLAIQEAALNGSGTGNQPLGLLNQSGISAIIGGANGAMPTYEHLIDLSTSVETANAAMGNLGYLTNAKVRGKLQKTPVLNNAMAQAVWGVSGNVSNIAGYPAHVTNAVPSNLSKGTANNCSSIMFGNWSDLMIGLWGGLDIMLDPYTGATSGTKRVVALQDVDVTLRRVSSFSVMKDALTQ